MPSRNSRALQSYGSPFIETAHLARLESFLMAVLLGAAEVHLDVSENITAEVEGSGYGAGVLWLGSQRDEFESEFQHASS